MGKPVSGTSRSPSDKAAYQQVKEAFKSRSEGATAADIVAGTALPLETVRELIPRIADEYSARLEVTESGEILYSFPRGFTSRYRGLGAALKRFGGAFRRVFKAALIVLFKVWIMAMLVGYFVLFMVIALAALAVSAAASSSGSTKRSSGRGGGFGGLYLGSGIFNAIIRIWFFSELLNPGRSFRRERSGVKAGGRGMPLYKAVFDFVFGPGDPNARWDEKEKRAVIAYIQGGRGVISVPELAALTGRSPHAAEERILEYCVEFGGSPEASGDGTVVYRFDDLLLRADKRDLSFSDLSGPVKGLRAFSSNSKKANRFFALINGVNLVFGGYFLFNALQTGVIQTQAQFQASSYLYGITYVLSSRFMENPLGFITTGLGWVPLAFSALFWLIPALRFFRAKKDNEKLKLENFRKSSYLQIWRTPLTVNPREFIPRTAECEPANLSSAQNRVIREMGSYAVPEVSIDEKGGEVYSFPDLDREKRALEKYRAGIDAAASELGKTVFDSGQ
jgi:hypothetical protein